MWEWELSIDCDTFVYTKSNESVTVAYSHELYNKYNKFKTNDHLPHPYVPSEHIHSR